jgi:[ribosomal protein S5]-alanine N-acetyltransferase
MTEVTRIRTRQLELIPAHLELAKASLEEPAHFGKLIGARVPSEWPPIVVKDVRAWLVERLSQEPSLCGWLIWYMVSLEPERVVIGHCGFKGRPDPSGSVEVGYAVLDDFQRRNYATEAVAGLLRWAQAQPGVRRVVGQTLPHLAASIRVLTKNDFSFVGAGSHPGSIMYVRELSSNS